ncbi:putative oxidoreductase [Lachnellula suecica]|uniref:Putative oxidoreductase n=1 Tax=Lachnellula suecica TaxID=602035 RepID=A0A8T9C7V0_9HELO|nr:putative oxidoreductase [Lachnellula suecica]
MTSTTYPEFDGATEGKEVARVFAEGIRGKTILITGVNRAGIGFTTAEAFASQSPAHLIIAGRTESKLKESIDALRTQFPGVDYRPLKLDLSSQHAVREASAKALSWSDIPTIDIIVNSAGIMLVPERTLSEDGIEMHFATNHIGHFLFTCLLMPKLIKASRSNPAGATRIVNVSSLSPTMTKQMRWSDMNFEKINGELPKEEQPMYDIHRAWGATGDLEAISYLPLEGYNQSKVANVLFGIAANKKLYEKYGILSLAVHPGVIETELVRHMTQETQKAVQEMRENGSYPFITAGAGAATSTVAALDPSLGVPEMRNGKENYGAYLIACQISDRANPGAVSSDEAEKLWRLSEELVREKFSL